MKVAPKLTLNLKISGAKAVEETKARVAKAVERKEKATETMEDAWQRILSMKNSESDRQRLAEVKEAMTKGEIGRSSSDLAKRFSKAEALRLWKVLHERQRDDKIREMVLNTPGNYVLVIDGKLLKQMLDDMKTSDLVGFDCETFGEENGALDPWKGEVAGFSISTRTHNYYVPLNHEEGPNLSEEVLLQYVKPILEQVKTVMHNAPFDCKWFMQRYGINLIDNLHADSRIMAMALDENRNHRLKDLITDWLRQPSDNFDELFGKTPFNEISLDVALVYAAGDTEKTLKLYDWIMEWFDKREDLQDIKLLVFNIEMPVCRQFIKSDLIGINFDEEKANVLDKQLAEEEAQIQREIYELFDEEINLGSPVQLKKKLFADLKLPDVENGSTGVKALKKLKGKHPVISKILDYRGVSKLREAFTQKLPKEIKHDNKIHPWHNTYGAATGRFTCKSPNTQQIPAKRPEIRHLFTSSAGKILVSIDYSQIELRVLAHMAKEPELIKAFKEGRDIHSTTAAMISNGKYTYEDIETNKDTDGSPEQKFRKQAKVVNFGIVYGMSDKGLADTLGITRTEAQTIIDNYFKGYKGIQRYMDEQKLLARKQGYITDIFGRKRRLHAEYKSKDRFLHFRADRMAGNFPIQASAGSILKKAIVDLQSVLLKHNVDILLQVHDELLFECPGDISKEALFELKTTMENAVKLLVPVRCDVEINPERWLEKVSIEKWFNEEEELND